MCCSTSSSIERGLTRAGAVGALLALVVLEACVAGAPTPTSAGPLPGRRVMVLVLPPDNLSGSPAPLAAIDAGTTEALVGRGLQVVAPDARAGFLARHRIRYTGGISRVHAEAAQIELGAELILITSVLHFEGSATPRFSVMTRAVTANGEAKIVWMDGIARTAEDHQTWLGLGVVREVEALSSAVLGQLAQGLVDQLAGRGPVGSVCASERRFRPVTSYVSPQIEETHRYSVAVLPFVSHASRRGAGESVSLELMRALRVTADLDVVEPGLLRDMLLSTRVTFEQGVSLDAARLSLSELGADLALAGQVFDYQESGDTGAPRVSFSAHLLERERARILWGVSSFGRGDDGVWAFDLGRVQSASSLACRLVSTAVQGLQSSRRDKPTEVARRFGVSWAAYSGAR